MRKNIRVIFSILVIIALIIPITYSYAIEKIGGNINEKSFFEISSLEATKNEKIEMTINLDEIKYNKFLFELKSSQSLEDVEVSEELVNNSKDLEVEKSSNEIAIEINKETTNLDTITLYYQIPEKLEVNDTIKFIALVTNMESEETEDDELIENDKEESEPESKSLQIEVKIVEEKEEQNTNKTEEQDIQNENNKNENEENKKIELNQQNITAKSLTQSNNNDSSLQLVSKSVTTISSQKTETTVTYNGSDNNYLNELYVSGYTLNKEFTKDNSTYFVTVENDVDSLDIVANQAEDSAVVCIYGNENLSEGTNKILISVTAENGNVRNYRIYVTKN